jgi:hypothetical protein
MEDPLTMATETQQETNTFRAMIQRRINDLGWSRWRFARHPLSPVHPQTMMRYLRGDRDLTGDLIAGTLPLVGINPDAPGFRGKVRDDWTPIETRTEGGRTIASAEVGGYAYESEPCRSESDAINALKDRVREDHG